MKVTRRSQRPPGGKRIRVQQEDIAPLRMPNRLVVGPGKAHILLVLQQMDLGVTILDQLRAPIRGGVVNNMHFI